MYPFKRVIIEHAREVEGEESSRVESSRVESSSRPRRAESGEGRGEKKIIVFYEFEISRKLFSSGSSGEEKR